MRLLVTGLGGFVGQHVAVRCPDSMGLRADLRDPSAVLQAVKDCQPDAVIHLAAKSSVAESFRGYRVAFDVNLTGTCNLLEALRHADFTGRFLFVGSGDVYGQVEESALPVTERYPTRPRNPYAASKVAAEAFVHQWAQNESQFACMMTRSFNHTGPGQDRRFAIADFAAQVAAIARGDQDPVLTVGDIDVTRDFTDVRDVVSAYFAILEGGRPGEIYNVCSGREISLRDVITQMIDLVDVPIELVVDPARLRRAEQRRMCGSSALLQHDTAWAPSYSLEQTLRDTLAYWKDYRE
ncbi:MAG: GDP-mannose 4,6-dehydratase [Planctomycetota bacterium]|nr:GDP-mannose 4,6-dehydratase [Planctomycetota bacterium]